MRDNKRMVIATHAINPSLQLAFVIRVLITLSHNKKKIYKTRSSSTKKRSKLINAYHLIQQNSSEYSFMNRFYPSGFAKESFVVDKSRKIDRV